MASRIREGLLFLAVPAAAAGSALHLPSIFSHGMVLQAGMVAPVWGHSEPEARIRIHFAQHEAEAIADSSGAWKATLPPLAASAAPDVLRISAVGRGAESLEFRDVLVGEVWICVGEANMFWPLGPTDGWAGAEGGEEAIARPEQAALRLFADETNTLWKGAGWQRANPQSRRWFSALAWYFGAELYDHLRLPVGLIQLSCSRTILRDWMPLGAQDRPNRFEELIRPLSPFAARGVVWRQGESDAESPDLARNYGPTLRRLIEDWRGIWAQETMPWYIVQLPGWGGGERWPLIRQGQLEVSETVRDAGLAVTIDAGDFGNPYPPRKREPGERLAWLALARTYGHKILSSGPHLQSLRQDAGALHLTFDDGGAAMCVRAGEWSNLEVAGADGVFQPAAAKVSGNEAEVSSPSVSKPLHVRYGWSPWVPASLFNIGGLPAAPFVASVNGSPAAPPMIAEIPGMSLKGEHNA